MPRLIALILVATAACAADRFVSVAVSELGIDANRWNSTALVDRVSDFAYWPRVELEHGVGRLHLSGAPDGSNGRTWRLPEEVRARGRIIARLPADADLRGWLAITHAGGGVVRHEFSLPAAILGAEPDGQRLLDEAESSEVEWLLRHDVPGAAWFRHRLALLNVERRPVQLQDPVRRSAADSMDLFSGGRAIAENLQLDRGLRVVGEGAETMVLAELPGITVAEIDWAPLIAGKSPDLDPLATVIPADQHALFIPSFAAMGELLERADTLGTPLLHGIEPRAEDARTGERYQRQLCLGISELARRFGPQIVDRLAITGGDPFLRTGSDIAVLFAPKQAAMLQVFLAQKQAVAVAAGAAVVRGEAGGVAYVGAVTADRSVCSYLATVGEVVVVTNSLAQLARIGAVARGEPALATTGEYRFFRERYPRGAEGELGLVVLSDAAIRRWCSPRWRIAESRRTRALAQLAELQARRIDAGASAPVDAAGLDVAGLGRLTAADAGMHSAVYGGLAFATPIAELAMDRCTPAEADAYARWRERYQANWRQWFDPIALCVKRRERTIEIDLTVIPLIAGSDYRALIEAVGTARLAPLAGDPHPGTLWHWCMAIDPAAQPVRQVGAMLPGIARTAQPSDWLGGSLELWAEDGPFWHELAAATDAQTFLERNLRRLPFALRFAVADQARCALFLAGLRAFIEGAAPDMLRWENREFEGQAYVRVAAAQPGRHGLDEVAVHYLVTAETLLFALDEEILRAAIRRAKTGVLPKVRPWLGASVAARVDLAQPDLLALALKFGAGDEGGMRRRCWANLPILDAWKRKFPDQDPVAVHERAFGVRLICPGGGTYVYDPAWKAMASTVYGHPGVPKLGPRLPPGLAALEAADAGLTFEHGGLRAVLDLRERAPAP